MKCPDTDRLIDLAKEGGDDPGLVAHLSECSDCRQELRLIQELPAAFRGEEEVPERLIQRVMAEVFQGAPSEASRTGAGVQVFIAGALGWLTTVVVVLTSGMSGGGSVGSLLLYATAVGVAVGVVHPRMDPGTGEGSKAC